MTLEVCFWVVLGIAGLSAALGAVIEWVTLASDARLETDPRVKYTIWRDHEGWKVTRDLSGAFERESSDD